MSKAKRRFPRVSCDRLAEMAVPRGRAGSRTVDVVPVTVRSMTCDGMGIALSRPCETRLRPDAVLTVRMTLDGRHLELPARVAWHARRRRDRRFDLGVRLDHSAAAPNASRAYALSIVELITQVLNREEELGAILLRVARLPLRTLQFAIDEQREAGGSVGQILLARNAITRYELRLARVCQFPRTTTPIPPTIAHWQRSLFDSMSPPEM